MNKKSYVLGNLKNIIVILFFWMIGVIMGGYMFYAVGVDNINNQSVVAAFNSGCITGQSTKLNEELDKCIKKFNDYLKKLESK